MHVSFCIDFHRHHLAGVEESRREGHGIGHAAGNDETVFVESRGVFREQPLVGGVDTAAEDPPLAAVGMSRYGEVDGLGAEVAVVVFGVMGHEDLVALLCGEGLQHGQIGEPARIEKSRAEGTDDYAVP